MLGPIRSLTALAAATSVAFAAPLAAIAAEPSLIRDAEIEHISRALAAPIFAAAGLNPTTVEIHIVSDERVNAFVAHGQRVFLNTGLLLAVRDPLEIAGVIAHETGHIAGGHLARTQQALQAATTQSILAFILGAAAIAGGVGGDAGVGVLLGGRQAAEGSLLRYSRAQESSADQAALTLLNKAGYSSRGLISFMELMAQQEGLIEARQDPYLRSHPMFPERISALRERAAAGAQEKPLSPEIADGFPRMQAKIIGFTQPLGAVLRSYPVSDRSVPARYARAIADHRLGRLDEAMTEMTAILAINANDAYALELRGQILLESGRVADAIADYTKATALAPKEPLIRVGLASALLATDDPKRAPAAIEALKTALDQERDNGDAWRQLALAFNRAGDDGQAALASAEQYLLGGAPKEALRFAEQALRRLTQGSPGYLRAQDIKRAVESR
ncbi:MAG: tetratricopeptide repeat protein [Alphaproteobacteria bacterium]|nr:tetratricopeptide repeat protein [Alphaproteobacteria bacterium]